MNYMDYASDDCQNMFTTEQKRRTRALFASGGWREQQLNNWFKVLQPSETISCVGTVNLQNPACLSTVAWSVVSGPASIISGQNTNQVTLQSSGAGNVVLRATSGNYISEATIPVDQNGPDPITNINTEYLMVHCNVIRYKWTVVGGARAKNYKWYIRNITQGTGFTLYKDSYENWCGSPADGSCDEIEVRVEARNNCNDLGMQSFLFNSDMCPLYVDGSCTYGRSLSVTPNPSSSFTQLQLIDAENVIPANTQPKTILIVRVMDKMGQVKKNISGNGLSQMSLNLSNLPSDIYTILVYDGKAWMSKQIVKN